MAAAAGGGGDGGELLVEKRPSGVAVVTLNRPDRLNALSYDLMGDLHDLFDDLTADRGVTVVVLTGAGRGFCAGVDLQELDSAEGRERMRSPMRGMALQERLSNLIVHIRRIPQPVIAAVNGPCVGGGMALACASEIRVASASARFGTQFIRVGVSGTDVGISYTLPRLVGAARAFEMILTGRIIDAAEADRIGLVTRVVPDGEVVDAAVETAEVIAGYSPFGVWMTKEVLWANLDAPSAEAAIRLEDRTQILASFTGDLSEASAAFVEKRKPVFKGWDG